MMILRIGSLDDLPVITEAIKRRADRSGLQWYANDGLAPTLLWPDIPVWPRETTLEECEETFTIMEALLSPRRQPHRIQSLLQRLWRMIGDGGEP